MSDDNIRPFPGRGHFTIPREPHEPTPAQVREIREHMRAEQERSEKLSRIKLARDLLVSGRVSTVADAYSMADAFADEALARLPHPEPDGRMGAFIGHGSTEW